MGEDPGSWGDVVSIDDGDWVGVVNADAVGR